MIKALLDKVGNVLEKEFLFGSFLPALLFLSAVATTFATVIGFQATFAWLGRLEGLEQAALPASAAVIVVVFAYVLSGIQPLMVRFWSGNITLLPFRPIANLFRVFERRKYLAWRQESRAANPWKDVSDSFNDTADRDWQLSTVAVPEAVLKKIWKRLRGLDPRMGVAEVEQAIDTGFLQLLQLYSGESLAPVYYEIRDLLQEWHDAEEQRIGDALWRLDRSYGSLQNIHATELGNIIESYTDYSYKRYQIEPQVFWPHLQTVVGGPLKEMIANTRTMLDFALTMASLGLVYMLLAAVAGPWIYAKVLFWGVHILAAAVVTFTAYRTAVVVAKEFGDLFRAAFDLHRLDLLAALRLAAPARLSAERDKWHELSELVLYAKPNDLEIAPAPASAMTG